MLSVGRKFLVAGKGGLNLTHAESREQFLSRYGKRRPQLEPLLDKFGPEDLRVWVHDLSTETFVGTSDRVFPVGMKTAPILRAWLQRLRKAGVTFHMRHNWCGWGKDGSLQFETPDVEVSGSPDAAVLALGGGSWVWLGSNGAWFRLLVERGFAISALKPANGGFDVAWSEHFRTRFEGFPLKSIVLSFTDSKGIEKAIHINGVKAGLLREFVSKQNLANPECLASAIKELSIPLIAPRPLDEAISNAGGVLFEELDEHLMIRSIPGIFCAGEMLDWETPTGGYLLMACFAGGRAAGLGALAWFDMAG